MIIFFLFFVIMSSISGTSPFCEWRCWESNWQRCLIQSCNCISFKQQYLKESHNTKKMLENRPEDALGTLVKLVRCWKNSSQLFKLYKISHTLKLWDWTDWNDWNNCIKWILKKVLLTHSLTDNLKARDASASKKENDQILILEPSIMLSEWH